MSWLYLALGSAISFASLSLLSRKISVNSKNPRALSFVFNLVAIIMSFVIFFITQSNKNFVLPQGITPYIYIGIAILCYGVYERLRFIVAKELEVSLLTIIGNTSLVVAFIVAFFINAEAFTYQKLAGFLLILIALVIISVGKILKVNYKGILLAIIANVILGVAWALDKKGVFYFNAETYNLLTWTLPLIILFLPKISLREINHEIKIGSWKIVLLALFNVVGYYIQLKAIALADATKVIPVVQTSTIITVLAGIIFLQEKDHVGKKIIAAILAVIGVCLLA